MLNKTKGKFSFEALYRYLLVLHDGLLEKRINVEPLIESLVNVQTKIKENIAEVQQK